MKHVFKISILMAIMSIAMFSCKDDEKEKTLVSIAVTTQPTKTTYIVGESFSISGMVVTATFSDKSTATITVTDAMIQADLSTPGSKTVTITYSYEGKTVTTTVTVTVTPRSVSVGAQAGTLIAGTEGSVTFPVTTAGVANGTYTATVATLPEGVTVQGSVDISNNAGTLTLAGDETTAAGSASTLTLIIDGITSPAFTLTIAVPKTKTVEVGVQSGTMLAGKAGTVTFQVTTENIANGTYSVTVADLPEGVSVQGDVEISNNAGTLTLAGDETTVGSDTPTALMLTLDGVNSTSFSLSIAPRTITVGLQVGQLTTGEAGTVKFPFSTINIADGTYEATVATLPTGVSVQGKVTITNRYGELTLAGNASTVVGATTLTMTIDGVTSASFTLNVSGIKTVSVGIQEGILNEGSGGVAAFTVTTENIITDTYPITVNNLPPGVTQNLATAYINNGTFRLTLIGDESITEATISTLTLTINGVASVTSAPFTLEILEPKTITVETQNRELKEGDPGTITFPVTTKYFANSTYIVSVSNLPAGVTLPSTVLDINNDEGTLTLAVSLNANHGDFTNLQMTIHTTTSDPFTLQILPAFEGSGGSGDPGSSSNPFNISMANDLARLARLVNAGSIDYRDKYYILADNITLSGNWTPIGSGVNYFRGHFDGNGKKVSGLSITGSITGSYTGFFGNINNNGSVRDLGVVGTINVTGGGYIGGLAGSVTGTITNCYAAVTITSNRDVVGGLVGSLDGSMTNCYATGNVSGREFVGGLAGIVQGSGVTSCFAAGNVSSSGGAAGGFAGQIYSNVTNCYATGNVSVGTQLNAGGFVGQVGGSGFTPAISNCYATGAVSGASSAGGFAGRRDGGSITNCAALNPSITRTSTTGLVTFGRMTGYGGVGTGTNNVAFDEMTVPIGTITDFDGTLIDKAATTTQTTYTGTDANELGWPFNGGTPVWKWTGGAYLLPVLNWQDASNYPAMPAHL